MTPSEPAPHGGEDGLFPISSLADSRASRSARRVSAWRSPTCDGSGRSWPALSPTSAHAGSSSKTCPVCAHADSPMFEVTSADSATGSPPARSQLARWAPHIHVSGCSFWPTPKASDAGRGGLSAEAMIRRLETEPKRSGDLNDAIGGPANPEWVEWLMGYPPGWTGCGD